MKYQHILEIDAKEWFDRVNGNSYFSAVVTLDDEQIAVLPFQYGYGDHFVDMAFKELATSFNDLFTGLDPKQSRCAWLEANKVKLITNKQENCLKREL
jgi:hypothetical protein